MDSSGWDRGLDTPGKRVHAIIVLVAVLYAAGHLLAGAWLCGLLLEARSPLTAFLVTLTLLVALGNLLIAAPLWVFAAVALVRGPRPIVPPPVPVPDHALPRVVVQIPGRNESAEHVHRSIASVLHADYPRERLHVQFVDNSDDDRWAGIARHYAEEPRVEVAHRDGTVGFKAANLNLGLRRLGPAGGEGPTVIGLLDVGDTFAPAVLRPMATEFVHDERLGFVQGMFRTGNPRDTIISWSESYVGDAARRFTEGLIAHYGIPTMNGHCALLRRDALEDAGGWNESRVAEDWNTGIAMMIRGWGGKWVDYDPTDPAMVSTELVPGGIAGQQKQKRRWATGGTELARFHLVEWIRSSLPWNQRLSLFLRFAANFSVLPGFLAQLLLPLWVVLAVSGEVAGAALAFGFASVLSQSPFLLANTVAAVNYARERNWRTAVRVVIAYPVEALWRLPLFSHAGIGIAEGLNRGLKEFVITPKNLEGGGVRGILRSQRLVLLVSLGTFLPLPLALVVWDRAPDPVVLVAMGLPLLTICALFLVPLAEFLRQTVLRPFRLPRVVYPDGRSRPWVPSGWMGRADALTMDLESTESPHSGDRCIEVTYSAPDGWVGVAWQNPADDWGDRPGGLDLTGAERLSFWARGREGGERITFGVGLLGDDKLFPDSVRERLEGAVLEREWRRYTIPLRGKDLSRIKSGFLWCLEGQGRPVTFYLDDVRFE